MVGNLAEDFADGGALPLSWNLPLVVKSHHTCRACPWPCSFAVGYYCVLRPWPYFKYVSKWLKS